jgi:hypothetical protein
LRARVQRELLAVAGSGVAGDRSQP